MSISESGARVHQGTVSIAVAIYACLSESSLTANVLDEENWTVLEQRRRVIEGVMDCDHDVPYSFALPFSHPQVHARMRLLTKAHTGELQPQAVHKESGDPSALEEKEVRYV
jgi:hypothetical protein